MNLIQTTQHFDQWFEGLRDMLVKRSVQMRIDRAEMGNFGDCQPVGAGYRVYFKQAGASIVVLLAGGGKSSQRKDIALALQLANDLDTQIN